MKKYKILLSIIVSLVISFAILIVPASAASSDVGITYYEFNSFDRSVGNVTLSSDNSIYEPIAWGKFWDTGVKPGYMVYMSGGFNNPNKIAYQDVFLTVPRMVFYSEIDDIDYGLYINPGDVIQITGDFVFESKNNVEVDFIRFGFICYDEDLTTYRFSVDVDLSDYNSYDEAYFELSHIYDPPNSTSLHVGQVMIQLHIPNFGPAYSSGSGQVGFGMFSPGLGLYIGSETGAPKYSAPDSSAADKQDQLTGQIENSTSEGIKATNNMFSSFNSLLGSDSSIYRGLLSVTAIMNEFINIDFLDSLLNFSLVLGIFSFLLGMGFFISKFARSRSDVYKDRKAAENKR